MLLTFHLLPIANSIDCIFILLFYFFMTFPHCLVLLEDSPTLNLSPSSYFVFYDPLCVADPNDGIPSLVTPIMHLPSLLIQHRFAANIALTGCPRPCFLCVYICCIAANLSRVTSKRTFRTRNYLVYVLHRNFTKSDGCAETGLEVIGIISTVCSHRRPLGFSRAAKAAFAHDAAYSVYTFSTIWSTGVTRTP